MSKKYKIKFCDKVLDPVHGFIDLTEVESKLIELPIFKRMQSIKQLSLTNWIFPGAEHTRYIHSLGVMHIADLMAQHLSYSDEERQLVRLAGLLHDIGHYPLSHVTESVYRDNLTRTDDILEKHNDKVIKKVEDMCEFSFPAYMTSRYNQKTHHEAIGATVIKHDDDIKEIINKYCPFIDVQDICDIIVGCVDRKPEISGLVQLIHSELDADGIDYVMRDSTFSGTCYGGFELGMLLRNLVRKKVNGVEIIGIRPKGIAIADQYLISKYFSYTQIVFNKHVSVLETMAEFVTRQMIRNSTIGYPDEEDLITYAKAHKDDSFYLYFTDTQFWSHLKDILDHPGGVKPYLVNMTEKLSEYQELIVKDNEFVMTSNKKAEVQKKLKESQIYENLCKNKTNTLVLLQERGFTEQMPEKEFVNLLNTLRGGKCSRDEIKKENTKRMQEGVTVVDGRSVKMLVDCPTSIMSHLYGTKTYILREYKVS